MSRRPNGGTVLGIWQRDKGRCWICGHKVPKAEASRDHVTPRSVGGYDKSRNYRLAHELCNNARGNLSEFWVDLIHAAHPKATAEQVRQLLREQHRLRGRGELANG